MAPNIKLSGERVAQPTTQTGGRHLQTPGASPVGGGAVSRRARRPLSGEHGCSEQEGRRPERQRAGDKGHGREAQGGQDKAAAVSRPRSALAAFSVSIS